MFKKRLASYEAIRSIENQISRLFSKLMTKRLFLTILIISG